jgi:hypothetical protein
MTVPNQTSGLGLNQLDQGSNIMMTRTWLGPSFGWSVLPVAPQTYVQTSSYVVSAFDSRLLLMVPVSSIQLPSVEDWMLANDPANFAGFGRELCIKDLLGNCSVGSPCVVSSVDPAETIDGSASYSIVTPNEYLCLYPIYDTVAGAIGWYSG